MKRIIWQARLALAVLATICSAETSFSQPFEVLVADRGQANVYRYDSNGVLLNTVIDDNTDLEVVTGLALSPDKTKLYVSSSGNDTVRQYNYDKTTGTASGGTVFASGLAAPSAIKFSQDGSTIFVSSNGGAGVYQFTTAGASAGDNLMGGEFFVHGGLEFSPSGELLVVGFADAMDNGGVLKADLVSDSLTSFIAPNAQISWASGIAVHGDDLYVVGLDSGSVMRFDANTGVQDPGFGIDITYLGSSLYPQDIRLDPSGNGLLVGILGTGQIARFGFDGAPLGLFADYTAGGFLEPTAFIIVVPEPASIVLLGGTLVGLVGWRLRRRAPRVA